MATSLAQVELQLDGELSPEATQRIKKLADVRPSAQTKHSPGCRAPLGCLAPSAPELSAAKLPAIYHRIFLHAPARSFPLIALTHRLLSMILQSSIPWETSWAGVQLRTRASQHSTQPAASHGIHLLRSPSLRSCPTCAEPTDGVIPSRSCCCGCCCSLGSLLRLLRSGRFSIVQHSVHLKEQVPYAAKVVENKSLGDEENLEALETEVSRVAAPADHPPSSVLLLRLRRRSACRCICICRLFCCLLALLPPLLLLSNGRVSSRQASVCSSSRKQHSSARPAEQQLPSLSHLWPLARRAWCSD